MKHLNLEAYALVTGGVCCCTRGRTYGSDWIEESGIMDPDACYTWCRNRQYVYSVGAAYVTSSHDSLCGSKNSRKAGVGFERSLNSDVISTYKIDRF